MMRYSKVVSTNPKHVGLLFLFIGIVFLIIGIVMGRTTKENEDKFVSVNATISSINHNNSTVFVSYEFNEIEYEEKVNFYSSSMRKNDEINVLIDPENPNNPKPDMDFMIILISIFSGMGGLLSLIGLILLRIKKPLKTLHINGNY